MSYASEVLADSPVGYWALDEPSGTNANDQGSGNNDGTYTNTPTLGVTGPVTGATAVTFTASSGEYVSIPDNAAYDFVASEVFTIEAWVKVTGSGSSWGIFTLGEDSAYMRVQSDGTIHLLHASQGDLGPSTTTVNDNTWHHVVWSRSSGSGGDKIYIDTVDRTGTISAANMQLPHTLVGIGCDINISSAATDFMDGSIAQVALYSTALSSGRVTAHYNAAAGTPAITDAPERLRTVQSNLRSA